MGVLQIGRMYRPTDIAADIANDVVYVVEQFNHRISKWNYTPASFAFTIDAGQVTSINVTNGGTGYNVGDPVDISAPTLDIANPVNATAEVATETAGVINTITVTNGGNGYDPNNLPTVTATTGGSGAILEAVVSTPFGTNGVAGTPGGAGNGGPSDTNLQYPTDIVLNSAGNLLISDTRNHRIRVMDSDGNFIESFGTAGQATTGGEFYRPSGLDADNTDDILMIADEFNNRCQAYSSVVPYTFIGISNQPTGLPTLYHPAGVTYDSTNDVFLVSERLGNHVNEYEDDGVTFTAQFGSAGTDNSDAQNSLYRPTGGHGIIEPNTLSPLADSFRNRIKEVDSATDTITHFLGQVGKGATATVTIAGGVTTSYNVTNGGTGYATPPTVILPSEAGAGTGATSDVTISSGAVTVFGDLGGILSGYTNGENITLSGGTGSGATATAVITDGVIQSVTLTNGGSGFLVGDTLTITGDTSSTATATIDVSEIGAVTAIAVVAAGSGFTNGTFDISFNLGTGTQEGDMYQPNSAIGFVDTSNYTLVANTKNNRIEVFEENQFRANFGSPFV